MYHGAQDHSTRVIHKKVKYKVDMKIWSVISPFLTIGRCFATQIVYVPRNVNVLILLPSLGTQTLHPFSVHLKTEF